MGSSRKLATGIGGCPSPGWCERVDGTGTIVREAKLASEPDAIVAFFRTLGVAVIRIGLEAGPLSQWPHAGLTAAGLPAILIKTRHVIEMGRPS